MFARIFGTAAAAALAAGCTGDLKTDYQHDRERAVSYVTKHPDLEPDTAAAIRGNDVRKGMTMEQVIAAWGPPVRVNRFRDGAYQVWFFGCSWRHQCSMPDPNDRFPMPEQVYNSRAYFENGRLVDWTS